MNLLRLYQNRAFDELCQAHWASPFAYDAVFALARALDSVVSTEGTVAVVAAVADTLLPLLLQGLALWVLQPSAGQSESNCS